MRWAILNGHPERNITFFFLHFIFQSSPLSIINRLLFSSPFSSFSYRSLCNSFSLKMADNRFLGKISTSTIRSLISKSVLSKNKRSSSNAKPKFNNENVAPLDPNVQISDSKFLRSKSVSQKPLPKLENSPPRELATSDIRPQPPEAPEPPVKVMEFCDTLQPRILNFVSTSFR